MRRIVDRPGKGTQEQIARDRMAAEEAWFDGFLAGSYLEDSETRLPSGELSELSVVHVM